MLDKARELRAIRTNVITELIKEKNISENITFYL